MKKKSLWVFIGLAVILGRGVFGTSTEELQGLISRAEAKLQYNKVYSITELKVTRAGRQRPVIEFESFAWSKPEGEISLTIYRRPANLAGTAFLITASEVWLRSASSGRVRKLGAAARGGSISGTDFSYDDFDLTGQGFAENYNLTLEREKVSKHGEECYKILLSLKAGHAGTYRKIVAYLARKNLYFVQLDYYEDGANTKTLELAGYRTIGGKAYPMKLTMLSHLNDSRTEILTTSVELDSPRVKEELFTVAYLEGMGTE